jgi:hypothetical protein
MNYEINVSRNGRHYFSTAPRSLDNHAQCMQMVEHFQCVFPVEQGYKITATRTETTGTVIFNGSNEIYA